MRTDTMQGFPTEDFIEMIRQQPTIWDVHCNDYSKRALKRKTWEAVVKSIVPDFSQKARTEKKALVLFYKRKWKSLRVCYSREIQKRRKNQLNPEEPEWKTYMFYEELNFLRPTLKKLAAEIEESSAHGVIKEEEEDQDELEDGEQDIIHNTDYDILAVDKEKIEAVDVADVYFEKEEKPILGSTSNPEEDEDRLFLLSLVSELKRVPNELKLEVKAGIIDVLVKARKNTNYNVPILPENL